MRQGLTRFRGVVVGGAVLAVAAMALVFAGSALAYNTRHRGAEGVCDADQCR